MGGKTGLVSCVTPVYNGEAYVGRLLNSVLEQTYPLIEMILVDDGSGDETLKVAAEFRGRFAEKGWRYEIVRGAHRNASAAINRGLPLVRGEFLIWPDSDDILEPDSVNKRVMFLQMHPEYRCVRSLMHYFDDSGLSIPTVEPIGSLKREWLFWDVLEGRSFVCCGCYMLRTEEFFAIYPKRCIPEFFVGQNFQMLLPYLYRFACPTIQEELYGVCRHLDSDSQKVLSAEQEREKYRAFEYLIDEISRICEFGFWERRRVLCWKLERRYSLARKQGKRLHAAMAKMGLILCGWNRVMPGILRAAMRFNDRKGQNNELAEK